MTDNIQKVSHSSVYPNDQGLNSPTHKDLHAADDEVVSLYYQSTISSLAAVPQNSTQAELIGEKKVVERSFLSRTKDWFWGIFGWGKQQPVQENISESIENQFQEDEEDSHLTGVPQLQAPGKENNKRLSHAIADLNRDLINRLKDMAEFEEEMKKGSAAKLDKFIFLKLVHCSIEQKKLKETHSLISQEDLLHLHKKNKKLQNTHHSIVDNIHSENKVRGILKWINVGLTTITVGGTAVGFAMGGPGGFFAVGLPLSFIGKGCTMLTDGILKYKTDRHTGDLEVVRHQTRVNNEHKKDKLNDMQHADHDIATLLKKIRQHLDNQSKAERASFTR
jgi:hypothetical protein